MGALISGLITLVIIAAVAIAAYFLLKGSNAPSSYEYCAIDKGDITRSVTDLFSCPDPNDVCAVELQNKNETLALVEDGEGGLLESSQESWCVDNYCPAYTAYLKCKCTQCKDSGDWSSEQCVNLCFWGSSAICETAVNCAKLVDSG